MQEHRDIPSQLPAKQPVDLSWLATNEIPAIQPGLLTWDQAQQQWNQMQKQQKKKKEPVTPIPRGWHDELPKSNHQRNLPVFREAFDFDKFSAHAMKVTVLFFAFLFLLVCLTKALIDFAFMK